MLGADRSAEAAIAGVIGGLAAAGASNIRCVAHGIGDGRLLDLSVEASGFGDGAPVPSAPDRASCAPALPEDEIEAILSRRREARTRAIDAIEAEWKAKGRHEDRTYLSLVHDFERATMTTNRAQLEEIGVRVPAPGAIGLPDDEIRRVLWSIIYGLERLHVYLLSTDHLDDRRLLERLVNGVLQDEIRDLPPSDGVSEFIDFGLDGEHPDGLVGPFEPQDEDEAEFDPQRGPRVPGSSQARPNGRRDHLLPHPSIEPIP
ncbi:MAG: hypothetical protein ACKO0W_11360 [Planctomycetota bacterium]